MISNNEKTEPKAKIDKDESSSLEPLPEDSNEDIEFSLCGDTIKLGNAADLKYIFDAHKITISKHEIGKYISNPYLVIRIDNQYYDANSFLCLHGELLNEDVLQLVFVYI